MYKQIHINPFAPQLIRITTQLPEAAYCLLQGALWDLWLSPRDTFLLWLLISIPNTCPGAKSQIEMEHDYLK